jgi:tetratricopeptide (TPR) repeat protein
LFIAYELGAWVVRSLLSEISHSEGGVSENPFQRLDGIIFLGADKPADFEHSTYLENRLKGKFNEQHSVHHRFFLPQILFGVDARFADILRKNSTGLASKIWILPPFLTLHSPVQVRSPNFHSQAISVTTKRADNRDAQTIYPLSRSDSQSSITRISSRGLRTPQEQRNRGEPRYPSEALRPDNGHSGEKVELSRHILQNLIPDAGITSEQSTASQDGYLYIKKLGVSTGMEDNMSAIAHPSTSTLSFNQWDDSGWRTSNELGTPGLQSGYPEVFPESVPGSPLDATQDQFSQLTLPGLEPLKKTKSRHPHERSLNSIEQALLEFQNGDYVNTRNNLEKLRVNRANDEMEVNLIPYHLAVVLTRLGNHHEAFQELENLQSTPWFQQMTTVLDLDDTSSQSLLADSQVEVVLGTSRLTALLWGYYGHYQRAKEMMEIAKSQCSTLLESSIPQTPRADVSHAQGYPMMPMQQVAQRNTRQLPVEIKTLRAKIDLAKAKLMMLQGEDGPALVSTKLALRRLEKQLGRRHILTLEAAALNSLILSRKFDVAAESCCITTINAMSETLGREHPLTMEVMNTLVSVFLKQSRPYEALDTVAALFEQATQKLGKENPQTLRYLCQLGDVDLCVGNYRKAGKALEDVYETARRKWVDRKPLGQYPDVLKYQSKWAVANSYIGKLTTAQDLAKDTLVKQAKIFKTERNYEEDPDESVNAIFDKLGLERDPGSEINAHPDILDSLANYATILEKSADKGPAVFDMFERVYDLRESFSGPDHYLTLQSGLDFGFACLGTSETVRLGDPAEFFGRLSSSCEKNLGVNHIFTWRAKLGDLFIRGFDYEIAQFRSESSRIMRGQTAHLGQSHPIVIDSLLRLFLFQLMLEDKSAHDTADLLLTQVRLHTTREQRLMESLRLEEKLAELYCRIEHYEYGLPIFDQILKFLKTAKDYDEEGTLKYELGSFKEKLQKSLNEARDSAANLRDERMRNGVEACSIGDAPGAESSKRQAALLSRSLWPEAHDKTVEAFMSLAEFLYDSPDTQKRIEGITVLSDLLADIRKARSKSGGSDRLNTDRLNELYGEIEYKYASWQRDLYRPSDIVEVEPERKSKGKGKSKGMGREDEERYGNRYDGYTN